jgi:hypothetical protein
MNYDNFKKIIKEIVYDSISTLLKEGISQTVFHFCPLNSLYFIVNNDEFVCTPSTHNRTDQILTSLPKQLKTGGERYFMDPKKKDDALTKLNPEYNKTYNYYMCVSRSPYSRTGYQGRRRSSGGGWTSYARIELDGSLLNSRFKGMPVNYFTDVNRLANHNNIKHYVQTQDKGEINEKLYTTDSNGNYSRYDVNRGENDVLTPDQVANAQRGTYINKLSRTASGKPTIKGHFMPYNNQGTVDSDETDMRQMTEYEDRIYTNQEKIQKFNKYIVRVDIYVSKNDFKSDTVLYELKKIQNVLGDKVFIYDNEAAFNSRNIRYSINKGRTNTFNSVDKSFLNGVDTDNWSVSFNKSSEISNISMYFCGLISEIVLRNIGTSAKDYSGKEISFVNQALNQEIKKIYPTLVSMLGLSENGLKMFNDAFARTKNTILSKSNPYTSAVGQIRMAKQRIPLIDAPKQEAINKIKEELGL